MRIHSTLRERVYTGAFIARKVQWFTVNRSRNIPVASMERWKQMMTDELTGTLQRYQKDLPLVALGEGPIAPPPPAGAQDSGAVYKRIRDTGDRCSRLFSARFAN